MRKLLNVKGGIVWKHIAQPHFTNWDILDDFTILCLAYDYNTEPKD